MSLELSAKIETMLDAIYNRLMAEKISGTCPPEVRGAYDQARNSLAESGVSLNAFLFWGVCTVDVLHEGSGESFTYQGVLLQDQRGTELVINTGNIAADYRHALLRCFGAVTPGASVYLAVARSGGRVVVVEDSVLGSVPANVS